MNHKLYKLARIGSRLKTEITYKGIQSDSSGWKHHRYSCWLEYGSRAEQYMETPFRMGLGHDSQPEIKDFIYSLGSDSQLVDPEYCLDFDEWCSNLGYNSDSISNREYYDNNVEAMHDIKQLFGQDYEFVRDHYQLCDEFEDEFEQLLEKAS